MNASTPPGERVYAIGDVHGRSDLLDLLHCTIIADRELRPNAGAAHLVYLGDYIDRGNDAAGVLERLTRDPPNGFQRTLLKGNHEEILEHFLVAPDATAGWMRLGGLTTMRSYGVDTDRELERGGMPALSRAFAARFPFNHRTLIRSLRASATIGDYFFCHAGIRPGVALDRQTDTDLLWIREPFLSCREPFEKVVVHGHTPVVEPEAYANRINVDTGAYRSNRLTALVLEGSSQRFLTASVP